MKHLIKRSAASALAALMLAPCGVYAKTVDHTVSVQAVKDNYVSLRDAFEGFGADVSFDWTANSAEAVKGEKTMVFPIGESYAMLGEEKVALEAATYKENNRVYVSVDAVKLFFGASVSIKDGQAVMSADVEVADPIDDYSSYLERSTTGYIGSSKYSWSIKRGNNFAVNLTAKDGSLIVLSNDANGANIRISLVKKDVYSDFEDQIPVTIDMIYEDVIDNYSIVESLERGVKPSGTEYVAVRTNGSYREMMESGDYVYTVSLSSYVSADEFERLVTEVKTFDLVFDPEDTEDCLSAGEGLTFKENKTFNFTIGIPSEFTEHYMSSDEMMAYSNMEEDSPYPYIAATYISSQEGKDYLYWAEMEYSDLMKEKNLDVCTVAPIQKITVDGKDAALVSSSVQYSDKKFKTSVVFVQNGNYIFILHIELVDDESGNRTFADVVEGLKLGEVDPELAGVRIMTYDMKTEREQTYTSKPGGYMVTMPTSWSASMYYDSSIYFDHKSIYASINTDINAFTTIIADADSYISNELSEVNADNFSEVLVQPYDITVAGVPAKRYSYIVRDHEEKDVGQIYDNAVFSHDGKIYCVYMICSEDEYGQLAKDGFEKYLSTFRFTQQTGEEQ